MNKRVIDLFAGCGGFSVGFEKAGYKITKAVEFDKNIAKSYCLNHPNTKLFIDDIGRINDSNNFSFGEADVIIGGPPCQGFSMAGARIRDSFVDDPRNYLFKQYLKVVQLVKPDVFILENVKGILTMNKGVIFKEIVKAFSNKDNFNGDQYSLYFKVIKALDFGIPQKRERVIVLGIKNRELDFNDLYAKTRELILKEDSHFFDSTTVWDAISNLPNSTNDGIILNPTPITEYQKYLSYEGKILYNHSTPHHTQKAINRMARVKQGENWMVLNEKINSVHSGAYGRLEKNSVAPTITTRFDTPSGGQFTHPFYNRTLTPREAARIQSFPDSFIFTGSKSIICKTIGNAVPPKISYFFGRMIEEIFRR